MAKRFTDSRKYSDPWFRKLKPRYKLIWDYMLHSCNHAGVWKVDFELASFCIGDEYSYEETEQTFLSKLTILSKEKWFIRKFIEFQYGPLNPENRVHNSVLEILEKEGAWQGLPSPSKGDKNKDKDKNKNSKSIIINNDDNTIIKKLKDKVKIEDLCKQKFDVEMTAESVKSVLTEVHTNEWEAVKESLVNKYSDKEKAQVVFREGMNLVEWEKNYG